MELEQSRPDAGRQKRSMICPELIGNWRHAARPDLSRFRRLHPDGQELIRGWFQKAWEQRGYHNEDAFEPFIFAWIAFNGWGSCVTGLDQDRQWINALSLDPDLQQMFDRATADPMAPCGRAAREFHSTWPIFKAQALRRAGVREQPGLSRAALIERYLNAGVEEFAPQCAARHRQARGAIPLDWPHSLAALYRVRCNLFHGEKARHSEMDRWLVGAAFKLLTEFVADSRILGR
jgi:hypothetical protein